MVAWKNDDELFALMRETLYSSVIGDILDKMNYLHQFLPWSPCGKIWWWPEGP